MTYDDPPEPTDDELAERLVALTAEAAEVAAELRRRLGKDHPSPH